MSQLLLLVVVLLLVASGTHASAAVESERESSVDVVKQSEGLVSVSQTTSDYNSTTDTANLTVTVTNQITVTIDEVEIAVGGVEKSTEELSPGEPDSTSFSEVECTETIVVKFTVGSLSVRVETPIECT